MKGSIAIRRTKYLREKSKGSNEVKKLNYMKGHKIKARAFPLELKRTTAFIREMYKILSKEADKTEDLYLIRPTTSLFWLENGERVYIENIIRQPELSLETFYNRSVGLETDVVYHNTSKSCNMLKRLEYSPLLIYVTPDGKEAVYYTFPANNLAVSLTKVNELAMKKYRKR